MTIPNAFKEPSFEALFDDYVAYAINYVKESDIEAATHLEEAFRNDGEMLSQVTQAFMLKRLAEIREQNYWALQMFRKFVTETDMVDLLAAQYQLKRQVLEPEDTSVFPPKATVMESNENLLQRFDLAPYMFHTTGTRAGYRFHALTLDERPTVTVNSEPDAVVMRFEFPTENQPAQVKDARAKMLTPNSGQVQVALVSRENPNGTANAELIKRASDYLNRDDIAQETDEVTVKSCIPKPYTIEATLFTGGDPVNDISKEEAQTAARTFADKSQLLEGRVERLELGHVFYSLGAKRVEITQPSADVLSAWDEAPYCQEVIIHVKAQ